LLFARLFSSNSYTVAGGAFAIVVASAGLHVARPLYKREGRLYTWLLALLPLAVFATAMGPLLWLAHGACVKGTPEHWLRDVLRFVVAGGFSMPLGTTWFVWYLAVTSRLDAHNNEAGGAARVTSYRQLIRFNLRADGLTGYVIAIGTKDDGSPVRQGGKNLFFELIDVFTLPTPHAAAPIPGLPPKVHEIQHRAVDGGSGSLLES